VTNASMGPRLFRRGNMMRRIDIMDYERLQWGHVFSDVEINTGTGPARARRQASMGPRLFRRGNYEIITARILEQLASMGPRLFRRGNPRR